MTFPAVSSEALVTADLLDLCHMWTVLEGAALGAALDDPESLRELLDRLRRRPPSTADSRLGELVDVHLRLAAAGGNERLVALLHEVLQDLGPYLRWAAEHRPDLLDVHALLLAIRAALVDPSASEVVVCQIRSHVEGIAAALVQRGQPGQALLATALPR